MSTPVSSGDLGNSFLLNAMEFSHVPGLSHVRGDNDGDNGDPSDGSYSSSSIEEDFIA